MIIHFSFQGNIASMLLLLNDKSGSYVLRVAPQSPGLLRKNFTNVAFIQLTEAISSTPNEHSRRSSSQPSPQTSSLLEKPAASLLDSWNKAKRSERTTSSPLLIRDVPIGDTLQLCPPTSFVQLGRRGRGRGHDVPR